MDKSHLCQYIDLQQEIQDLKEEKTMILAQLKSSLYLDGQPHSKGKIADPTGSAGLKLAMISSIIDEKTDQLVNLRRKIEAAINPLPSSDRRFNKIAILSRLEMGTGGRTNLWAEKVTF